MFQEPNSMWTTAKVVEKYEEPSSYLIEHPNGDLLHPNRNHLYDGTPLKAARIADKNSSIVRRGLSTRRPSASFQCLVLSCCGLIWFGLLWGLWPVLWWSPGAAGSVPRQGHECFCWGSRPGLWDRPILQQAVSLSLRGFLWVFQCRALRAEDHQLGLAPY